MNKIVLDSRKMQHPEPLEKATDILNNLKDGDYLYMINNKNPMPLFPIAEARGLVSVSVEEDNIWHIIISANRDIDLSSLVEKL